MQPVVRTRDGFVPVRVTRRRPTRFEREATVVIVLLLLIAAGLVGLILLT